MLCAGLCFLALPPCTSGECFLHTYRVVCTHFPRRKARLRFKQWHKTQLDCPFNFAFPGSFLSLLQLLHSSSHVPAWPRLPKIQSTAEDGGVLRSWRELQRRMPQFCCSFVSVVELNFAFYKPDLITLRLQTTSRFTRSSFGARSAHDSAFYCCSLPIRRGIQVPRGLRYRPGSREHNSPCIIGTSVSQNKSQGERSDEGAGVILDQQSQ